MAYTDSSNSWYQQSPSGYQTYPQGTTGSYPLATAPNRTYGTSTPVNAGYTQYGNAAQANQTNMAGKTPVFDYSYDINAARGTAAQYQNYVNQGLTPGANGQGYGYFGVSAPTSSSDPTWAGFRTDREGYGNLMAEDLIKQMAAGGMQRAGNQYAGMGGAGAQSAAMAANAGNVAKERQSNYDTTFDMASKVFGMNQGTWNSMLAQQNQAQQQALQAAQLQQQALLAQQDRAAQEEQMNYQRQQQAQELARRTAQEDTARREQGAQQGYQNTQDAYANYLKSRLAWQAPGTGITPEQNYYYGTGKIGGTLTSPGIPK